ncbi:MAG: caspase family protein, partial [Actinobacteria bacterium]|nr:caspase family protein [Actinomycetota bacterium]
MDGTSHRSRVERPVRRALLLGGSDYKLLGAGSTPAPLSSPAYDLAALYLSLTSPVAGLFNPENVYLEHDVSRADAAKAIQALVGETPARPNDLLLFYFSGHALSLGDSERAAFCFSDSKHGDQAISGLGFETVFEMLNQTFGEVAIVLDCCFSGRMATFVEGPRAKPRRYLLASSGPDGAAQGISNRLSVFTDALCRVLSSPTLESGPARRHIDDVATDVSKALERQEEHKPSFHCSPQTRSFPIIATQPRSNFTLVRTAGPPIVDVGPSEPFSCRDNILCAPSTDETLDILRRSWRGEPLRFKTREPVDVVEAPNPVHLYRCHARAWAWIRSAPEQA